MSASSSRGDLSKAGGPFPSTSCLTSEIAPADSEPPPPDNMSDVSAPSMSALTVAGSAVSGGEGVFLGPSKGGSEATEGYLLPEDLVHLTRRSLFLVVDSDNSSSFARLQVRRPPRAAAFAAAFAASAQPAVRAAGVRLRELRRWGCGPRSLSLACH